MSCALPLRPAANRRHHSQDRDHLAKRQLFLDECRDKHWCLVDFRAGHSMRSIESSPDNLLDEHTTVNCNHLVGNIACLHHPQNCFRNLIWCTKTAYRNFCHKVSAIGLGSRDALTARKGIVRSWQHGGVSYQRRSYRVYCYALLCIR